VSDAAKEYAGALQWGWQGGELVPDYEVEINLRHNLFIQAAQEALEVGP
jgi:hypothetical protein